MSVIRQQRWQRAMGWAGGSRLARPPQRPWVPDIRPTSEPDCVPPPPLTIHDTFDRGSYPSNLGGSVSTSGHTWTAYRGVWTIDELTFDSNPVNSTAYLDSLSRGLVGFDYGTTDVEIAARWQDADSSNRGLFFRYDGTACYVAGLSALTRFTNLAAGTSTNIATYPGMGPRQVMEVTMVGNDIEIRVDGTVVASVTDGSPFTGTKCGLYMRFADFPGGGFLDWGYPYNGCEPDPVARVP